MLHEHMLDIGRHFKGAPHHPNQEIFAKFHWDASIGICRHFIETPHHHPNQEIFAKFHKDFSIDIGRHFKGPPTTTSTKRYLLNFLFHWDFRTKEIDCFSYTWI